MKTQFFDFDLGEALVDAATHLWETLVKALTPDLGGKLASISEDMAGKPYADYTDPEFVRVYMLAYFAAVFFAALSLIVVGAAMGLRSREAPDDLKARVFHPFTFGIVSVLAITLSTIITGILDAFRTLFLIFIHAALGSDWYNTYESLEINMGVDPLGVILTWLLIGVLGFVAEQQYETTILVCVVAPFALLFAYALKNFFPRAGRLLLRLILAIFGGFALSLPVLVLVYGIGAIAVGLAPVGGFVIAWVTAVFATLTPWIIAALLWFRVDFSKVIGGQSTIKGKTDTKLDPDSKVEATIKARAAHYSNLVPPIRVTPQATHPDPRSDMAPRFVAATSAAAGRLVDQYITTHSGGTGKIIAKPAGAATTWAVNKTGTAILDSHGRVIARKIELRNSPPDGRET